MSDHITAKYLSSLCRVMVQYDLTEMSAGDIHMKRGPGQAAKAEAKPTWATDGEAKFVETVRAAMKHDKDEIDPERVDADPAFAAFDGFGVAPGGR